MAFGVKTANMFELLGEGDSDDVQQTSIKPQAEPKKSAPVAAGAANVEARLKGATNGPVNGGRGGRGEGRGGRGEGRGGRGGRGRGFDRPPREEGQGEGGELGERGPGSRPFRGRGGERHYERDRRRGYDRHDNTGRGHETEKRGGGGGHNWGAVGEETPAAVEEVVAEEEKIDEIVEGEASAAAETEGDAQAAEPTEPKEPEKEEMTLEEYEKSLADKRGSLKKKPVNDVKVDTKAFEGMKVYKPTQEDNDLELSEKKVLGKSKSGSSDKARKEKELLPTGFRVGSDEGGRGRGRGDRGGRGGEFRDRPARRSDENGGGRGGRGYGRGDRPFSGGRGRGEGPLALDNKKAFPTLGGGNSPA